MKTKKIEKKLVLNKKNLVRLVDSKMKTVKAGGNPWVENPTTPIPCQ